MAYALLTGASSGIGKDLAKVFSDKGYNLVLVARNVKALEQIRDDIRKDNEIIIIGQDLTEKNAPQKIKQGLDEKGIHVDVLVNNAGFGDCGAFLDSDWNRQKNMVDLNVLALMEMTYLFGNDMKTRGHGRILNLSSCAALSAGPYMSIYYASKAFVLSFSQSVAEELKDSGVKVSAICPGPTTTGFEKAANMKGKARLFDFMPQTSMQVAKSAYQVCMSGKAVRYQGPVTKLFSIVTRLLPRSVTRKMAKRLNTM